MMSTAIAEKSHIPYSYIELYREKLLFTFDNKNTSSYYDEITGNFIFCSIKLNRTHLTAKKPNNTLIWSVEIPGNASIISVKISPDYSVVALQRSSYYIEFVIVTLKKQKQKLLFQSSASKKCIINNFFWLNSTHIIYVTTVGIELYELMNDLSLKLTDRTNVVSEWQLFLNEPDHLPILIVGKENKMDIFVFRDFAKFELYKSLSLCLPEQSIITSTVDEFSKLASSKILPDGMCTFNITSKNVKLGVIYQTLFLHVFGVHHGDVYMFKIFDMCNLKEHNTDNISSFKNSSKSISKENSQPSRFCSFILKYPSTRIDNRQQSSIDILFDDDIIYLLVGSEKKIYFYDISMTISFNLSLHDTNGTLNNFYSLPNKQLIVNPIDILFSSHYNQYDCCMDLKENQDKCMLVEIQDNHFHENDHILFLYPNLILNTCSGIMWSLKLNYSYLVTNCRPFQQDIVIKLLQRRSNSQKYTFQLIHEALVVKDYSFTTARKLLDSIVDYNSLINLYDSLHEINHNNTNDSTISSPCHLNFISGNDATVDEGIWSSGYSFLLNKNQDSSQLLHKFKINKSLCTHLCSSLLSPYNYIKSPIQQQDIFAVVFLPLMAEKINENSHQKLDKNFNLETILLHFISQLRCHNINVELFLYEAIIELMIKLNHIFQLQQIYQHGIIPKKKEIGDHLVAYCGQHPSLIVMAMDIYFYVEPLKLVQLLLDNQIITEAVRKYTSLLPRNKSFTGINCNDHTLICQSIISSMNSIKNMSDGVFFSLFNWMKIHLRTLDLDEIPSELLAQFKLRFKNFYT